MHQGGIIWNIRGRFWYRGFLKDKASVWVKMQLPHWGKLGKFATSVYLIIQPRLLSTKCVYSISGHKQTSCLFLVLIYIVLFLWGNIEEITQTSSLSLFPSRHLTKSTADTLTSHSSHFALSLSILSTFKLTSSKNGFIISFYFFFHTLRKDVIHTHYISSKIRRSLCFLPHV